MRLVDRVIIGVDPHKLSVTIEARDNREILRATGEFRTDAGSYRRLLEVARQWPERIWAVEGANGIGRPVTHLETRIVGDDGADADHGELWCRSPSAMVGYYRDEFVRTEEGWKLKGLKELVHWNEGNAHVLDANRRTIA